MNDRAEKVGYLSISNYFLFVCENVLYHPVFYITPSYFRFAYSVLRRFLPEEKVESIKGLALTADGNGAVFDVAAEYLDAFLAG